MINITLGIPITKEDFMKLAKDLLPNTKNLKGTQHLSMLEDLIREELREKYSLELFKGHSGYYLHVPVILHIFKKIAMSRFQVLEGILGKQFTPTPIMLPEKSCQCDVDEQCIID